MDPLPSPGAPAPARPLVPREHGAYGQLLFPLATALALGRPGLASAALAVAAGLAFVAHEPLLVLLGQRGARARREDRPRARRALAALGLGAAACAAAGLALAPPAARLALALPAALAGAVGALVLLHREKTLAGELVVAAALSSAGLPVALAGGVPLPRAAAAWVAWVLALAAATLGVRVVLARGRAKGGRTAGGAAHAAATVLLVAAGFALAARLGVPAGAAWALLPMALLSLVACLGRVPARRLRELGWAVVGAAAVTMAALVASLR